MERKPHKQGHPYFGIGKTRQWNAEVKSEMKTPMQELIEQMWEIAKYGDSYEVAPCIEAAEAMLEKEKEVMESAWQDGMYECDGDGTFEDFYKTFNTKEK
jgi:hypothetical protein